MTRHMNLPPGATLIAFRPGGAGGMAAGDPNPHRGTGSHHHNTKDEQR